MVSEWWQSIKITKFLKDYNHSYVNALLMCSFQQMIIGKRPQVYRKRGCAKPGGFMFAWEPH